MVFVQISFTTETQDQARDIAAGLVEARLAACVQIAGPIESHYWWEGRIQRDEEWLATVKTRASRFADVERAIRARHPYETPEILATPILEGSSDYLKWLGEIVPEAEGGDSPA